MAAQASEIYGELSRGKTARFDATLVELLTRSAKLFADQGYEKASMRKVAQVARISLPGLYYYVRSKEELLFLIQHRAFDDLCGQFGYDLMLTARNMLALKSALGFAIDLGGTTSHTAILARSMNVPAVVGAGFGVQVIPELLLSADFKYYFYKNTAGFEIPASGPFNPDGSLAGFGWENIYSIAFGVKAEPADIVALYAGYNFSDNPVPDSLSMINVAAPGIVQHHISFGIGIRATRQFEITAAYYHAFKNSGTGEILNPNIPPGTSSVTNTLKEDSVLLQFSYTSRGDI
jgi:AcrR family transcriptional regulator